MNDVRRIARETALVLTELAAPGSKCHKLIFDYIQSKLEAVINEATKDTPEREAEAEAIAEAIAEQTDALAEAAGLLNAAHSGVPCTCGHESQCLACSIQAWLDDHDPARGGEGAR